MFYGATSFNGDLSNFDTSRVTDMNAMLAYASSFNGDVSNFNTSSVTDTSFMFAGAKAFNQDLCSWQDSFPYTAFTWDIFTNSNCTYQDTPQAAQKGPFCASNCGSSSMLPSTSPTFTSHPSDQTPVVVTVTPYPTEAESSTPQESSVSTTTPSPPSMMTTTANVSSPPLASPDSVSVSAGNEVFVSVLDNDTPSPGDTLSINNITTQALNGTCSIGLDFDEVIYEPNSGFTGFDSCVYEACDSVPVCDTATVTVIVVGT